MCRYVGESLRVCARAFALVCVVLCAPLTHAHTERERGGGGEGERERERERGLFVQQDGISPGFIV